MTGEQLYSYTTYNAHSKYLTALLVNSRGEKLQRVKSIKIVDQSKIDNDILEDGITAYVSNLENIPPELIKAHYDFHVLIEELFRIMKNDLQIQPFYVHKEDAIRGVIAITHIALLILRLISLFTNKEVTPTKFRKMLNNLSGTTYSRKCIFIPKMNKKLEKLVQNPLELLGFKFYDNKGYTMKVSQGDLIGFNWFKRPPLRTTFIVMILWKNV